MQKVRGRVEWVGKDGKIRKGRTEYVGGRGGRERKRRMLTDDPKVSGK